MFVDLSNPAEVHEPATLGPAQLAGISVAEQDKGTDLSVHGGGGAPLPLGRVVPRRDV